jgi:hypothetical protein
MPVPGQEINPGYIYVMTNPDMPGTVKIGCTTHHPDQRAKQLSSAAGVPQPYQVIAFRQFDGWLVAEEKLHAMFRHQSAGKEVFSITVEQAQRALNILSEPADKGLEFTPSAPPATDEPSLVNHTNSIVFGVPYWTQFNKFRSDHGYLPPFDKAARRLFLRCFVVRPSKENANRDYHYEARLRIIPKLIAVRAIFRKAETSNMLFDAIAGDRYAIEGEPKVAMRWKSESGKNKSHITVEREDMDPREIGQWVLQHAWLSNVLSSFERVVRPRIEKLQLWC